MADRNGYRFNARSILKIYFKRYILNGTAGQSLRLNSHKAIGSKCYHHLLSVSRTSARSSGCNYNVPFPVCVGFCGRNKGAGVIPDLLGDSALDICGITQIVYVRYA